MALFFNHKNELLILKPIYRNDGWMLPGGVIEKDESPRQACIREIKEEIGFDININKLLCVDYWPAEKNKLEIIVFIFYGKILSQKQIDKIKLNPKEHSEYKFVSTNKAINILTSKLAARLPESLKAKKDNKAYYSEEGEKV